MRVTENNLIKPSKKVLFVVSSLKCGGAEKQTIDLINRLNTGEIEIFMAYIKAQQDLKEMIKHAQLLDLVCLQKKHPIDLGVLVRLHCLVKKIRPDTLLCVDPYPAFYAHLLRIFFRVKFRLAQVLHATDTPDRYNELIIRFLYRHMINRCDDIVFVSQKQRLHWIKRYRIQPGRCRVIHNGIDVSHFNHRSPSKEIFRIRQGFGIQGSDIVICICAAMRPEKKHEDLLKAARILIDKGYPLKILMVGDGSQREKIKRFIDYHYMNDRVIMTGFRQDVRPYVAASDIFVICSTAVETFSLAILEAMALAKPIVASDIGGASEQVIHGENGFLFPPGDIQALARSIETIIQNQLFEPMGQMSRNFVTRRFPVEQMVKRYEALLLQEPTAS